MTNKELYAEIAEKVNLSKTAVKEVLEAYVNTVISLSEGDNVKLESLGSFRAVVTNPRIARNPKTGESIEIPAKNTIKFKLSSSAKKALND